MRLLTVLLAAAAVAVLAQGASGQEAYTTRIETRPFYGAVVTIEHGVRVIRPLPPTQHLIINPNGATPLVLGGTGALSVGSPAASAQSDDE